MNNIQVKKKYFGIIGCLLVLLVPFFIKIINHDNDLATAQSLCPFKMLTGFPCAGCGITKSIICIYDGYFLQSIYYHLFGIPVVAFSVLMIILLLVEIFYKKEYLNDIFFSKKLAYTLGIVLGVYHFFRILYFIKNNCFDDILKQSIWQ